MQLPTIHINGTPGQRLRDQYHIAALAAEEAVKAIQVVEFHARDYYVQGDGAFDQAQREHRERIKALVAVRDDFLVIARDIGRQMRGHDRHLAGAQNLQAPTDADRHHSTTRPRHDTNSSCQLDVGAALAEAAFAEDVARQQRESSAPEALAPGRRP